MFTPGRATRDRVRLPASIALQAADGGPARLLRTYTTEISSLGVAVISPEPLAVGQRVRVEVAHDRGEHRRLWRWRGRVASATPTRAGVLVGIAFVSPALGPEDALALSSPAGRGVVLRLDPPWSPPACSEPGEEATSEPDPDLATASLPGPRLRDVAGRTQPLTRWLGQAVGLLGFCADQLTKFRAFAHVPVARGVRALLGEGLHVKNFGVLGGLGGHVPLANTAVALLMLGGVAFVARWSARDERRLRPLPALGWGLILAGLLGNLSDRLFLGYVRDFLQSALWPAWVFNLADLMAIAGVVVLAVCWIQEPASSRCRAPAAA